MAFRVGQKVVCVEDAPNQQWIGWEDERRIAIPHPPVVGQIYTVRALIEDDAIQLVELVNPRYEWMDGISECAFFNHRFRPLVEPKTELPACITALLDPKNHPPVPVEKEKTHV